MFNTYHSVICLIAVVVLPSYALAQNNRRPVIEKLSRLAEGLQKEKYILKKMERQLYSKKQELSQLRRNMEAIEHRLRYYRSQERKIHSAAPETIPIPKRYFYKGEYIRYQESIENYEKRVQEIKEYNAAVISRYQKKMDFYLGLKKREKNRLEGSKMNIRQMEREVANLQNTVDSRRKELAEAISLLDQNFKRQKR